MPNEENLKGHGFMNEQRENSEKLRLWAVKPVVKQGGAKQTSARP